MRERTKNDPSGVTLIEKNGEPEYAVLPYREYLDLLAGEPTFPNAVVKRHVSDGVSLIRAWREYKGMTQKEVADKLGMSQAGLAQIEKSDAPHKHSTLAKIAAVLEIDVEQLKE